MNTTRTTRVLAALSVSALALTACGGDSDPLSAGGGESNSDPNSIVVGSANFTESEIIAKFEDYASPVIGADRARAIVAAVTGMADGTCGLDDLRAHLYAPA